MTDPERQSLEAQIAVLASTVRGLGHTIREGLERLDRTLNGHDKRLDDLEIDRIRAETERATITRIATQDRSLNQEREDRKLSRSQRFWLAVAGVAGLLAAVGGVLAIAHHT